MTRMQHMDSPVTVTTRTVRGRMTRTLRMASLVRTPSDTIRTRVGTPMLTVGMAMTRMAAREATILMQATDSQGWDREVTISTARTATIRMVVAVAGTIPTVVMATQAWLRVEAMILTAVDRTRMVVQVTTACLCNRRLLHFFPSSRASHAFRGSHAFHAFRHRSFRGFRAWLEIVLRPWVGRRQSCRGSRAFRHRSFRGFRAFRHRSFRGFLHGFRRRLFRGFQGLLAR